MIGSNGHLGALPSLLSAKALQEVQLGLVDAGLDVDLELELDRRGSASPTARVPSFTAASSTSSFSAVVPTLSDVPVVKGLLGIDGKPMGSSDALCTLRSSSSSRRSSSVQSPSSSPLPAARLGPTDCTALQEDAYMEDGEAPPGAPEAITLDSIGADLFRASVSDAVEQIYPPPDDLELPDAPPDPQAAGCGAEAPLAATPFCGSPPLPVPPAASVTIPPSPLARRCRSPVRAAGPSGAAGVPGRGRVSLADVELLRVLGRGSFAKVFLVRMRDDRRLFAMKVLRKEVVVRRRQVAHTRSERAVLERVRHPFVVELRYAFQTPSKLYLVLDYMPGGELFFHLKREYTFSEDVARFYAAEICLALAHLHSLGIVYRDLKPENVLLDGEGHARLADFGLAKRLEAAATGTFCGTAEYMAPEVLQGRPYGTPADWWSYGTLLYEMLVGIPPFYSPNRASMQHRTLCAPLRFPAHVQPAARALLEGLLERDPARRLGAAELFEHAWFAGLDWGRLLARAVPPPFRPLPRADDLDVSNFDAAFTRDPPQDSPCHAALAPSQQGLFDGFSYDPTPGSARPPAARTPPCWPPARPGPAASSPHASPAFR